MLACAVAAACVGAPRPMLMTGRTLAVLNIPTLREDGWQDVPLRGKTEYSVVRNDGRDAVMAVGRHTASGLARRLDIDPATCRTLRWSWRVNRIQTDVDLRRKDKEDVAASLFLVFGDPGFMMMPDPVPTVRYVWTTSHMKVGDIFPNPFRPEHIRTIVVENREDRLGEWVWFERDLHADFIAAFGKPPEGRIHLVSIFTDNDQSRQPVESYYGPIEIDCRS
jgi:hypothetical protein